MDKLQDIINCIFNENCETGLAKIPDNSVNCILTDPPYLYLKNQKLDTPFDEDLVFAEFKRILKRDGFIVLFGRGTSFYRWNSKIADLGFKFKEEIVWDKSYTSSPLNNISRTHETISIHANGSATINRCKVPYLDMKKHDLDAIIADIKRLMAVFNSPKSLECVMNYIESRKPEYTGNPCQRHHVTVQSGFRNQDRCEAVMQLLEIGMTEKDIIKITRPHYNTWHPTTKPVMLIQRLLNLTTHTGDLIVDPFAGSCSTAKACLETGRNYICFEKNKDYFDKACEDIRNYQPRLF